MADEAYRAVFLRVHPTGKMVLSLTTESDGKEAQYAQLVADELGIPALDVKVVPADTDRFGVGHGYNTSPSERYLGGDRRAPPERSAPRGSCSRAWRSETEPESLKWSNGAWVGAEEATRRRSRRSRTSPSTRTAPVLCRRESRAGSTRRRSTPDDRACGRQAGIERDLDLVGDLQRPEQRRVGRDTPVGLLEDGAAAEPRLLSPTRARTRSGACCRRASAHPRR